MIVPNLLGGKFAYILGSLLIGGVIVAASTSTGQTPLIGGSILLPEFTSTGQPSTTVKEPAFLPVNAFVTASGGNVKVSGGAKYAAACFPNPLAKLGTNYGSGAWVGALSFQMGNNPSNVSYDVTYEKSCNAGSGGTVIVNNLQLASGAKLTLSGSRLPGDFNGADFVKVSTLSVPPSGTTMRVRGFLMDIFGE